MAELQTTTSWKLLFVAWLTAAAATAGSLFFSVVMQLTPCVLCWYQRIALFPLVLVLLPGLVRFEPNVLRYSLPLAVAGGLVALYHNALYIGLLPAEIQPCGPGASCTERHFELFGFLSIPLLSLLAFAAIIACLVAIHRRTTP